MARERRANAHLSSARHGIGDFPGLLASCAKVIPVSSLEEIGENRLLPSERANVRSPYRSSAILPRYFLTSRVSKEPEPSTFIIAEIGEDRGTGTSEDDGGESFLTKGQGAGERAAG